jgi:hypothetical protein
MSKEVMRFKNSIVPGWMNVKFSTYMPSHIFNNEIGSDAGSGLSETSNTIMGLIHHHQ